MVPTALIRQHAIDLLIASEPAIRRLGVSRLALFGSVVRDQARPASGFQLASNVIGASTSPA